jgi:hypothetical protein
MTKTKSIILIIALIFGGVFLILYTFGFIPRHIKPKNIDLQFDVVMNGGKNVPKILLTVEGMGQCARLGDLNITSKYNNNELEIDVQGYYEYKTKYFGMCPTVASYSRANMLLNIDWLGKDVKQLVIMVNGKKNIYNMNYNNQTQIFSIKSSDVPASNYLNKNFDLSVK